MVRLKSRRHQTSLLHQSAHRTNTSTLSLSQIRIMENLTDSWIAKQSLALPNHPEVSENSLDCESQYDWNSG